MLYDNTTAFDHTQDDKPQPNYKKRCIIAGVVLAITIVLEFLIKNYN